MPLKQLHWVRLLGMVVLGIIGTWVFVTGCGKDPDVPKPKSKKAAPPPEPQFKTWDKPAAVLILSGEQHGYIEPCGCSETQSGGLARRADLIRQLSKRGWPVAGLDLGGSLRLVKSEAGLDSRGSELLNKLQAKLKFHAQLHAMHAMRYSALAMGFEEIKIGAGDLLNDFQSRLIPQDDNVHPLFLGANILIYGDEKVGPSRTQTVKVGEVKIGVTAIVGDSVRRKLYGDNPPGDIEIKPATQVLPAAIQALNRDKTAFNVLLSQASIEETEEYVKQFPDFAIALCQSGEEGHKQPKTVGKTQIIQVGWKGKYVGLLGYYPKAEPQFRFELVELDNQRFKNDVSIEPFLIEYQKQLQANEQALYNTENMASGFPPKSGDFVGAATCGQCHVKAYEKWKTSKHAHAYESLKTGRKGQYSQPISRVHDPECLACHVTGWDPQGVFPYPSGFLPEALAQVKNQPQAFLKLQGQQCENCHGPGSEHVRLEQAFQKKPDETKRDQLNAGRRQMVLMKSAAEAHLCRQCHDLENSPKFNFDKYWEEIKHPWRD